MHVLGIAPRNKGAIHLLQRRRARAPGSDYCVSQLSKKQVQDISAMLGKGASTKPEEFKGHHKVR